MPDARLEVTDALGRRIVPIAKDAVRHRPARDQRSAPGRQRSFARSRRNRDRPRRQLRRSRDRSSRYGTFVNGEQVTERTLVHGDRIRLGRSGGAEMVFLAGRHRPHAGQAPTTTAIGDLRQIAALLEGLRALGSGRVLDDVLSLVLDSAIEVSGAERGFIMLAAADGELEFKMARGRGQHDAARQQLRDQPQDSRGGVPHRRAAIVADLLDGELANVHMGTVALGIRNVLCVPLRLVRYLDKAEAAVEERRIGVLYLDSREKGTLLSSSTRAALETLATEAAVAIENARLYRETIEKARMEQEMRIAAEIQQALLPKAGRDRQRSSSAAAASTAVPIHRRRLLRLRRSADRRRSGFALGDVAGKGPPAALLSAMMQGIFAAQAASSDSPSQTISRVNLALYRRGIESRFVTLMYGALDPDGRLTYCNAGHNPPLVISAPTGSGGSKCGGPIVGLFEAATLRRGDGHARRRATG